MKKKKIIYLVLMAFLLGCAGTQTAKDQFLTTSYQALTVMDTSYDAIWGSFVKLYKDGLVKEETFLEGRELALNYYGKWMQAALCLQNYAKGTSNKQEFEFLKTITEGALKSLKEYLAKQSGGVKPII